MSPARKRKALLRSLAKLSTEDLASCAYMFSQGFTSDDPAAVAAIAEHCERTAAKLPDARSAGAYAAHGSACRVRLLMLTGQTP